MLHKVFCLMGPTASGKTQLAIALAQRFPMEIISVDSALVYKEMDIGTAKPTPQERQLAAHHLIDIIAPDETYSAAQFCTDVGQIVCDVLKRGRIPLLVGGTMMYFKALQQGIAPLPAANQAIRNDLAQQAKVKGLAFLHARLQEVDMLSAQKIMPTDRQRILRALEVYQLTGQPISFLQQKRPAQTFSFHNMLLMPTDRAWLHHRIEQRLCIMMEQGFLNEVTDILKRYPSAKDMPSFKMVGYRQALTYFEDNNVSLFTEKTLAATRQLAKRQLTWLRHWPDGTVFDPKDHDIEGRIANLI